MRYSFNARGFTSRSAWTLLATVVAACSPDAPTSPVARGERMGADAAQASVAPESAFPTRLSNRFAYVWADQATSPSYSPSSSYSYNATGGSIQITRAGTGSYRVTFNSLTGWTGGTLGFAATAYGSSPLECQMRNNLVSGTQLSVYVSCFNRLTSALSDSRFTLLVVGSGSLLPRSAFAWADETVAPSYTPNPLYSYTSGPGPIQVTHGPLDGAYNVRLGTGQPAHSTVLVNAVAGNPAFGYVLCKVGQWLSLSVQVRCFDSAGSPRNHYYWILQVQGGRTGRRLGFAFANMVSTASYTPNVHFSSNSSGGAITAMRTSVGRYTIDFAGLQKLPGHTENVQVTPLGLGPTACKVVGWGNTATALRVAVECRKLNGDFVDTRYNVLVIE